MKPLQNEVVRLNAASDRPLRFEEVQPELWKLNSMFDDIREDNGLVRYKPPIDEAEQ